MLTDRLALSVDARLGVGSGGSSLSRPNKLDRFAGVGLVDSVRGGGLTATDGSLR